VKVGRSAGRPASGPEEKRQQAAALQSAPTAGFARVVRSRRQEYDRYGNMTCVQNSNTNGPCGQWTYNTSNQLASSTGCTYDAAGNTTKDCSTGHTYQWDAEGRVSSVDSGSTWGFTYNALGERVQMAAPGGTQELMYDPYGGWLGVYGGYDILWWGDSAYLVYNGTETYFDHINNISSAAMSTNHVGAAVEDILFYPWGQNTWELWGSGGYNFAGMPYYDTTTNTSLTLNRLQSPGLGRWLSPDPLGGDITDPQSLNRYAYVLNNPCSLTDPLGLQNGCGQNPFVGPGSNAASLGRGNLRPGVHGGGDWQAPRPGNPDGLHHGVDLSAAPGTALYPLLPGVVTTARNTHGDAGIMVEVNVRGGYSYDYMHLTSASVKQGDRVQADTLIGYSGTTGDAANLPLTEAHLHLQINYHTTATSPWVFMGNPCPHGVVNFVVRSSGGGSDSGMFAYVSSQIGAWELYQDGNIALTPPPPEEQSQSNNPQGGASSTITGWWPLE